MTQKSRSGVSWLVAVVGLGVTGAIVSGCSDRSTSGINTPGFVVSSTSINCPSDTVTVQNKSGASFPQGTTMTFTNATTHVAYDGGAMIDPQSGAVGGGLPSQAQAGNYYLTVTVPNGTAQQVATIKYTTNNC